MLVNSFINESYSHIKNTERKERKRKMHKKSFSRMIFIFFNIVCDESILEYSFT